ncbi:MAG TPA: DNA polymerase III subunit epsilon, partial [Gammaproteobacteria bacterium]|nr:DNA polymerase III subunit epsilon [Gammaproteobacteria bacterium]MCH77539.1 DNA polymerase III subunit epsilon [Gammaproteobacteria bacterium]
MRQIVLDTETTGLSAAEGHRVIEIGAVELLNRRPTGRNFHHYLQPDREIDAGAIEVHGISNEFLADKPRFADVAGEFVEYVRGAELVIHNAAFDVGFLNAELARLDGGHSIDALCSVLDTLALARHLHPGQRNTLDALCRRYGVDNSGRSLHGALLDAQILAEVYLAMTGGQVTLSLGDDAASPGTVEAARPTRVRADRPRLAVLAPSADELQAHAARLAAIDKA